MDELEVEVEAFRVELAIDGLGSVAVEHQQNPHALERDGLAEVQLIERRRVGEIDYVVFALLHGRDVSLCAGRGMAHPRPRQSQKTRQKKLPAEKIYPSAKLCTPM